jgi:hypothetical protein
MRLAPCLLTSVLCIGCLSWVSCDTEPPPEPKKRTLAEARQIVLTLFRELDGFELEKQREVGLAGRPAVRMEASWSHAGQKRRGILYVVDHPALFNVIHYTAPAGEGLFDTGYPVFIEMMRTIRVIRHGGPLSVALEGDKKVMRSPELQLEIRYPSKWVYTLDEVNRSLVFSGPRDAPTWLTTMSFSVINKFAPLLR